MPTAVFVPATATIVPQVNGAALHSVTNAATLAAQVANAAALAPAVINDAHLIFTAPAPSGGTTAVVGSAVVGTSTVG